MTHSDEQEHKRLKAFFGRVHEDAPPGFEDVAERRPQEKAIGWRWAVAAAAAVILTATTVLVLWAPEPSGSGLKDTEALSLAQTLSTWESPLDFLLDTPGGEIFQAPTLVSPWPAIPAPNGLNNKENST